MSLFKPAWRGHNITRALKVIAKETNQEKLAEIVNTALYPQVSEAAMNQLSDQAIITRFATAGSGSARDEAIKKLTSTPVLVDMAANDSNPYYRLRAMDRLENIGYSELNSLRKNHMKLIREEEQRRNKMLEEEKRKAALTGTQGYYAKTTALSGLTDQALFAKIDKVKKMTDQALLADLAENDGAYVVCYAAFKKIKDQDLRDKIIERFKKRRVMCEKAGHVFGSIQIAKYYKDGDWLGRNTPYTLCFVMCEKCGIRKHGHTYKSVNTPADTDLSSTYKCCNCDHTAAVGGRGDRDGRVYGYIDDLPFDY